MIARVKFPYDARPEFIRVAKDPVAVEYLKNALGEKFPIDMEWGWPDELLIDMDVDGPILTQLKIPFTVVSFKGTMPLQAVLPQGGPVEVYVQVPHIGLLAMDEVCVEENCCTDELQRLLDKGWRILCVCPPNAARRPDYILGRSKRKDYED